MSSLDAKFVWNYLVNKLALFERLPCEIRNVKGAILSATTGLKGTNYMILGLAVPECFVL